MCWPRSALGHCEISMPSRRTLPNPGLEIANQQAGQGALAGAAGSHQAQNLAQAGNSKLMPLSAGSRVSGWEKVTRFAAQFPLWLWAGSWSPRHGTVRSPSARSKGDATRYEPSPWPSMSRWPGPRVRVPVQGEWWRRSSRPGVSALSMYQQARRRPAFPIADRKPHELGGGELTIAPRRRRARAASFECFVVVSAPSARQARHACPWLRTDVKASRRALGLPQGLRWLQASPASARGVRVENSLSSARAISTRAPADRHPAEKGVQEERWQRDEDGCPGCIHDWHHGWACKERPNTGQIPHPLRVAALGCRGRRRRWWRSSTRLAQPGIQPVAKTAPGQDCAPLPARPAPAGPYPPSGSA